MVKIRLRRVGATKQPSYRIVVAESRSPRGGRFIETVGFYNPRTEPPTVQMKEDRILYWLTQGAQPTDAVAGILKRLGTMDRLARLKRGEALDVLLEEAAAASQPYIEKESPSGTHAPVVAEAEMQTKEVVGTDTDMNIEATGDVVNAGGTV